MFDWAQHLGDPYGENYSYVLLTLNGLAIKKSTKTKY